MNYLETKNIIKEYAGHRALDDVSIRVPKGCVYGLLGPNGAGKTTLIRIINRITAPDSGEVYYNGRLSVQSDVYNIGYLPEERGLYKKMRVGDQILFFARLKGLSQNEATEKMNKWMDKFEINSWKDKKIEELSKGMQQKIQFITTVIHDPDLLILDEPFSGFDPVNADILKKEILELKSRGKTIILSTHNMESVETLCDEITLINKSKAVLQGNVGEIRESYKKNVFDVVIKSDEYSLSSDDFSVKQGDSVDGCIRLKIQKNREFRNSDLLKQIGSLYEIISFEEEFSSMNEIFIQTVTRQ